jgi:hypothetical protein
MSQTAINVLAVVIFVMTFGSILAPALDLSPFVPAAIAFTGLLLATLDRFAFGNLGVTLLLDGVAQWSAEHRDRVVHHEAGHFLVAYLLGIPVTGYALTAWEAQRQGQNAQGGVRFDDQLIQAQIETGQLSILMVERYCQVWMAGGAAEKEAFGNVEGGVDDVLKVRSLLRQLQVPDAQRELKERNAALQAKQMLARNAEAYGALKKAMAERQPVQACVKAAIEAGLEQAGPVATL